MPPRPFPRPPSAFASSRRRRSRDRRAGPPGGCALYCRSPPLSTSRLMTTEDTAAKKDIQKLQRAIVDGLEDVKGHDIQVFDTEQLSPLFERVIVASGTSNRQTKALAASVRDAVREAGFPKPRIEGEENGEWIIVDCGAAVAHIMQPTFRQYYRLEDLWGDKPVRIRFGAPKPAESAQAPAKKAAAKKAAAKRAPATKAPSKRHQPKRHQRPRHLQKGGQEESRAERAHYRARLGIKAPGRIEEDRAGQASRAGQKSGVPSQRAASKTAPSKSPSRPVDSQKIPDLKLVVVAVGQRLPNWAQTAVDDYAKRLPPEWRFECRTVKTEPRASKTTETLARGRTRPHRRRNPREHRRAGACHRPRRARQRGDHRRACAAPQTMAARRGRSRVRDRRTGRARTRLAAKCARLDPVVRPDATACDGACAAGRAALPGLVDQRRTSVSP